MSCGTRTGVIWPHSTCDTLNMKKGILRIRATILYPRGELPKRRGRALGRRVLPYIRRRQGFEPLNFGATDFQGEEVQDGIRARWNERDVHASSRIPTTRSRRQLIQPLQYPAKFRHPIGMGSLWPPGYPRLPQSRFHSDRC